MKGFFREETRFSLCGLNCLVRSMHLGGYWPGCGGEAGFDCSKAIAGSGGSSGPQSEKQEKIEKGVILWRFPR